MAGFSRTTCATDAMHIIFGNIREIEIHHMRELLNIDPSRSNICGNKNAHRSIFESLQSPCSRTLAFISMDCCR
jgi:hypothetical protein